MIIDMRKAVLLLPVYVALMVGTDLLFNSSGEHPQRPAAMDRHRLHDHGCARSPDCGLVSRAENSREGSPQT